MNAYDTIWAKTIVSQGYGSYSYLTSISLNLSSSTSLQMDEQLNNLKNNNATNNKLLLFLMHSISCFTLLTRVNIVNIIFNGPP